MSAPKPSVDWDTGPYQLDDLEQRVDLLEYVSRVLKVKYRLVAVAMLVACMTVGATFLMPNKFTATGLVAFNRYDQPGGVKPKDYRGSDTVSLLERDIIIDTSPDNEKDRLLARLRSYDFLSSFIEKHDLMKVIFAKQWDDAKQNWKDPEEVSLRVGVKIFNEQMLGNKVDEVSGLMQLYITTQDAELSAQLVNAFVEDFKAYQRQLVLDELAQRRNYLEERLKNTPNLEFQRSIYRMLETQLSAEALVNVRKNYPIEMIEPALPPLVKSSPKRLLFGIVSFVATMFIGVTYVIGKAIWEKVAKELAKFDVKPSPKPDNSWEGGDTERLSTPSDKPKGWFKRLTSRQRVADNAPEGWSDPDA